jgi:hypothetical protein
MKRETQEEGEKKNSRISFLVVYIQNVSLRLNQVNECSKTTSRFEIGEEIKL